MRTLSIFLPLSEAGSGRIGISAQAEGHRSGCVRAILSSLSTSTSSDGLTLIRQRRPQSIRLEFMSICPAWSETTGGAKARRALYLLITLARRSGRADQTRTTTG